MNPFFTFITTHKVITAIVIICLVAHIAAVSLKIILVAIFANPCAEVILVFLLECPFPLIVFLYRLHFSVAAVALYAVGTEVFRVYENVVGWFLAFQMD